MQVWWDSYIGSVGLWKICMFSDLSNQNFPSPSYWWVLTHWGWDKIATFTRRHFRMHFFLIENVWISNTEWSLFLWVQLTILQHWFSSTVQIMAWRQIGDNWQTIIWTSGGLSSWRIYVSLGLSELKLVRVIVGPMAFDCHDWKLTIYQWCQPFCIYRTRSVFHIKNLCSLLVFSKSVFWWCPESVFWSFSCIQLQISIALSIRN